MPERPATTPATAPATEPATEAMPLATPAAPVIRALAADLSFARALPAVAAPLTGLAAEEAVDFPMRAGAAFAAALLAGFAGEVPAADLPVADFEAGVFAVADEADVLSALPATLLAGLGDCEFLDGFASFDRLAIASPAPALGVVAGLGVVTDFDALLADLAPDLALAEGLTAMDVPSLWTWVAANARFVDKFRSRPRSPPARIPG